MGGCFFFDPRKISSAPVALRHVSDWLLGLLLYEVHRLYTSIPHFASEKQQASKRTPYHVSGNVVNLPILYFRPMLLRCAGPSTELFPHKVGITQ